MKDVSVNVGGLVFPIDFYVLNYDQNAHSPWNSVILGRPFLRTALAKIDVGDESLSIEFEGIVKKFFVLDKNASINPFDSCELLPLQDNGEASIVEKDEREESINSESR